MGSSDPGDRGLGHPLNGVRRAAWWAWLTVRCFLQDQGLDRAAALAYVTLLSLVPLLAALAALSRSFFSEHTERIVEVITVILPYSTQAVEQTLGEFVRRATTLGGVGLLIFVAIAFRLFQLIETTLNAVWGTPSRRPITIRIFSFTTILFWGPVVMGLGSTFIFWLEHQPWAPSTGLLVTVGRMVISFVALTMVYWLAPHTGVHLGAAAVGGLTATAGLQLIRTGFVAYIRLFPNINFIFGSLALVVLFLISLFAFWVLVILGAEASYVAQNLTALRRAGEEAEAVRPGRLTVGLAVLAACYEFREEGRAPSLDDLVHRLGLTHRPVQAALERLVDASLVAVTGRERDRFLAVHDPQRLSLADAALRLSDPEHLPSEASNSPALSRLAEALDEAEHARLERLTARTFADLVNPAGKDSSP